MTKCQTFLVVIALAALCSCVQSPEGLVADVMLPYTPVKDQGRASTCWAYAMLSTIETEHILRGDSVHLSVAYVEKAMESDPRAPESKRAMGMTLINMIHRYGLVQYDAMPNRKRPMPKKAFFNDFEYTPQEFAHSVCAKGEYVALCTTTKGPYGHEVILNVPDNWEHNVFYNLPPDSLLDMTQRAVESRHAVCWEGDISESGFNFDEGYAVASFFSGSTTDDHCMAIVGLGHDNKNRPYFILKNSWGKHNAFGGLVYMSFDYFRQKTLAIYLTREARYLPRRGGLPR